MSVKALSDYTFYSRYAQYLPDEKRRETWEEAVTRVFNMHRKKYKKQVLENPELGELITYAESQQKKKRVLAAQRTLQFAIDPILKHELKNYNCTATHINREQVFAEIMYVLLCGCGAGFSVQKHHIKQLGNIKNTHPSKEKTFVIDDSIEGWAEAVGALMDSYFENPVMYPEYNGVNINFDFSKIRPEGSLIAGRFKAPGPEGLKNGLIKINRIIQKRLNSEEFKTDEFAGKLRPIDAYDIIMHISDCVLSGGVRRSATLCMFSHDDTTMMRAKTGSWFIENPQRGRSNNSATLLKGHVSSKEFSDLMESTKQYGEPGFIWVDNLEIVFNPCVEIAMYPATEDGRSGWQGCVEYNTKLLTKDGIVKIGEAAKNGQKIEIWNGEKWSSVSPVKTGENQDLFRVTFSDGSYLDVTDYHRFLVKNRFEKDFSEKTTEELITLMEESSYPLQVPRADIQYEGGVNEQFAYEYGFILGGGCCTKYSDGRKDDIRTPFAELYKNTDDIKLPLKGEILSESKNENGTEFSRIYFKNVDKEFAFSLKYLEGLPSRIFSWSRKSIIDFVAGWIDADGSKAGNGVRVYGREDKLRDLQLLLTKAGINSSVNLMAKEGTNTNITTRKKAVWYVQISDTKELYSHRMNLESKETKYKGKFQIIKSIEKLEGKHDSYCFEEFEKHQGVFNNVLTKQCNLTEINGKYCETEEKFLEACKASAIIGTLQAGYTDFKFLKPESKEIFDREALLGCSITGWMDNPDILFDPKIQRKGAKKILETNKKVAKLIGINPAARATCVKPAGSTSCVLGTASGIHPHHARRYIRRTQVNRTEFCGKVFEKENPLAVEKSVWSANGTDNVISFLCEVPQGSITKNQMSAVDLLEKVKLTQKNWVEYGTDTELCTLPVMRHNVSNTCSVQDDEWDDVEKFIFDNQKHFAGISLLSASGDLDYPQAPFSTVLTPNELVREYGDASVFASGLVVDGLSAFDGNLWHACDVVLERAEQPEEMREVPSYPKNGSAKALAEFYAKKIEYDEWFDKVDWIRRAKQFADRYFEGNLRKMTYCLKHVSLWKTWCDLKREYKEIDWTSMVEEEETVVEASTMSAQACVGAKGCDI